MKFLAHKAPFVIVGIVLISFLVNLFTNDEILIIGVNMIGILLIILLYVSISKYPEAERNWFSDRRKIKP